MPLTEKQLDFLSNCNHRWNIKTGATGSGKSFVDYSVVIPKRIEAAKGEGLLVLLGNTRGTLERNILEPMRTLWPGLVGDIRSDNTVDIFGRKVYALGADNKKHVSRIQGATFEYVYGDEITTWSEEVFQMLKSRLRCDHSHFDGTCNPENPNHWFKRFLDSDADIYQQSYIIDDGVLPAHVVEQLKKEYAGTVYYDRFILGLWAVADGLIYPTFSVGKNVTGETPWIDINGNPRQGTMFYISIDYGTVNPFSSGLWAVYKGVAYRWKEYYYVGRDRERGKRHDDEDHYREIKKLAGELPIENIIIDPAASNFVETIYRHGEYSVINADNSVLPGIGTVTQLLNGGRMKICKGCDNAIREFQSYTWEKNDGSTAEEVLKENDHAMDEIRYFAQTILRREFNWLDWRKSS